MFRLQGSPDTGWKVLVGEIGCVPSATIMRHCDGNFAINFDSTVVFSASALKELYLKLEHLNKTYWEPQDDQIPF